MANSTIPQLQETTEPENTFVLPVDSGAQTYKLKLENLLTYIHENFPAASNIMKGLVTTGNQTFAGVKTFNGATHQLGNGYVYVRLTANQFLQDGTNHIIEFNNVIQDDLGEWNISTHIFTAASNGVYAVSLAAGVVRSAASSFNRIRLFAIVTGLLNGVYEFRDFLSASPNGENTTHSFFLKMNAGDQLYCNVFADTNLATSTANAAYIIADESSLQIVKVR